MSTFPVSGSLAEGGVVTLTIDQAAYDVVVTASGATIWVSTDGTTPVAGNPNTAHRVPPGDPRTVPVAVTTGEPPTVIKLISEGDATYVIARGDYPGSDEIGAAPDIATDVETATSVGAEATLRAAADAAHAASQTAHSGTYGTPADIATAVAAEASARAAADLLRAPLAAGLADSGIRRVIPRFSIPFDDLSGMQTILATGAAGVAWTSVAGIIQPPATEAADRVLMPREIVMANGVARVTVVAPDNSAGDDEYAGIVLTRELGTFPAFLAFLLYRKWAGDTYRKYAVYTIEGNSFGGIVTATNLTHNDTNYLTGSDYALEVERKGQIIKFKINGRTIYTSATNTNYKAAGRVGLIAKSSWRPTFRDFSVAHYPDPPITPRLTKVVAIGTSITDGTGTTAGNEFRTVLKGLLDAGYAQAAITMVNGGGSGETSTAMAGRLAALLAANPTATVCLIEQSVNDFKTTGGVSTATTKANLRTMVQLCRAVGVTPVLWTCAAFNPTQISISLGGTAWTDPSLALAAAANNIMRGIAAAEDVLLVDVNHAFNDDQTSTYLSDGVHPNTAGHALIANTIFESMIGRTIY